jgi:FtsZ-binding cell division protein ZapB
VKKMPTLFTKKKSAMSAENAEAECIQALEEKIAEFKEYNDNLAGEVRSRFDALCAAYQAEGTAILGRRPSRTLQNISAVENFEAELTRWFNSKLSTLVNDYSPAQTQFSTCTAFALGFTEKYRKIKYLLDKKEEFSQETKNTQTAIEQLGESIQKYDLAMKHNLFYSAYQDEVKDTYQPPAERICVM